MIANKFEAKLYLPDHTHAPDVYDVSGGPLPADDFVISRHRNGDVASRFGDLQWNVSTWHAEGRLHILYFDFWDDGALTPERELIIRDARWLIFALVWLRDGPPLSVGTLLNYVGILSALALYAERCKCRVTTILSEEEVLRAFVSSDCSGNQTKLLSGLLSNLVRLGDELLGFVVVGDKLRKDIRHQRKEYAGRWQQHPPIPSRIYSAMLENLLEEISHWDEVSKDCLNVLKVCGGNPFSGRALATQQVRALELKRPLELHPTWDEIASPQVRAYLARKGYQDSITGLASAAMEVQMASKLTIQAFSGMRDEEALSLPYDCLSLTVSGGRTHRLINGRTTKLSKGVKLTRWVTNQAGFRAAEVAQKIADVVYDVCNASNITSEARKAGKFDRPLFVSVAYLGCVGRSRQCPTDGLFFPGALALDKFDRLRDRIQPHISEDDLLELEKIDPHRAWRTEDKFQLQAPWGLRTHQLRRSLALYAQRSGLVTLPSLRQQLQHLTDEMSRYYSRGSQYAADIFGSDTPHSTHFGLEWQTSQSESEALSYILNVLLTDSQLFGGHADFVRHHLKGPSGVLADQTRAETMRMFKKGQLHFRETLIGGCTRSDECESAALDWLSAECISNNCSNMVGDLNKLKMVVAEQERFLQSIPQPSLLHRTESLNLGVLIDARNKVEQRKNGGHG